MIDKNEKYFNIAVKLVIAVCSIAIVGCVLYFAPKVVILVLPFLVGYIIAIIMRPMVGFLNKRIRIPRPFATIISLIITVGIISLGIYFLAVNMYQFGKEIYMGFPSWYAHAMENLKPYIDDAKGIYTSMPMDTQLFFNDVVKSLGTQVGSLIEPVTKFATRYATNFATALPGGFVFTIVMAMTAYFMTSENRMMADMYRKLVPEKVYEKSKLVKADLKQAVGGYVRAQLIIMSVVFVVIAIGLLVARVEYWFLIALGIAAFDALPMLGSGAILITWGAFSMAMGDFRLGISLLIIYGLVILTRQLIEPKIVGKQIGLHPLATLLSMYVGLRTFGIFGMVLGPVMLMILIKLIKTGIFGKKLMEMSNS